MATKSATHTIEAFQHVVPASEKVKLCYRDSSGELGAPALEVAKPNGHAGHPTDECAR